MQMKTRNINFLLLFTALFFGFLSSCKKDDADIPVSTKPEIGTMEIGSDNNKTVKAGSDLHLEGEIVAEALIDKIVIEIHQEGGGNFKLAKVFTDEKYAGKKNATFHEHIDIPSEAPAGQYHFHFTVSDKAGNTTTVESPLTIQAADAKVAFKLVFTEVDAHAHGDHFHDIVDKSGVEPISVNFDNSGKALGDGHAHIKPAGVYKIDFKQFDAAGQEIQGQYIKDKTTASLYKAFLTGGAFVLNSNSTTSSGAVFQTKETSYGDGSAVTGAVETTGITSYFTAGKDNTGEKDVAFVLRKFKDTATKATITRGDWNRADYVAKYPGEDIIQLSFEMHAEEGED